MYFREEDMMYRTNIVLDDGLIQRAKRMTGLATIREVVHHALRELVRHRRQRALLKLKGKIRWEGDLARSREKRSGV